MSTPPRPPHAPNKRKSNVRLYFPGSSSSSPKQSSQQQLQQTTAQTARPSTTGTAAVTTTYNLATFDFPTVMNDINSTDSIHQRHDDHEGSLSKVRGQHSSQAPSMRQQLGYALGESSQIFSGSPTHVTTTSATTTMLPSLSSSSLASPTNQQSSVSKTNNNNYNRNVATLHSPSGDGNNQNSANNNNNNNRLTNSMNFGIEQTKLNEEAIRREKAANALAEALLKWPSSANPLRAPTAEATIRRRIQHNNNNNNNNPSSSSRSMMNLDSLFKQPHSMAETVLDMIDICNSNATPSSSSQKQQQDKNQSNMNDFKQQRRNNPKHPNVSSDPDSNINDDDDHDDDLLLDPKNGSNNFGNASNNNNNNNLSPIQHKYPPRHHRPAQRDFLSWSTGAATGFESFASVSRWVDWVLQEAQFHSSRIEKEEGSKNKMKEDALDLAEVMKSNFDGLLVDAATYYEEIQARATEINDCIRAWSRGYTAKKNKNKQQQSSSSANKNQMQQQDSSNSSSDYFPHQQEGGGAVVGPGETFLVRAAFLVLDRVLSGSTMMNSVWPLIRNALLKGLYMKGDSILMDAAVKNKIHQQNPQTNSTTTKTSTSSSSKQSFFTTEEISACLANNTLVMEQYDELLSQFRDAERQRFHLESTTSQLSAFSDLTARHASRRLIRSAFKAWRQAAQQGRVYEKLIVHFARQAKAKEIVGRNLHRWRSYMQMQRRNKAVKYSDEIRKKMNQEKAEHQAELKQIKDEHEKTISHYEIRLLHLQQQYDAAVEGAHLDRTTLENEVDKLNRLLDKAEHHVQQWRTAALLSRPTEGPDAVALYADDEKQKQAVMEMSLALAPPSKKLQILISVVRGTEDALYLATLRTAQEAAKIQAMKLAAQRRQLDGTNMSASVASPTQASLARSSMLTTTQSLARTMSPKTTNFASTIVNAGRSTTSRSPKRSSKKDGAEDDKTKNQTKLTESVKRFEVGAELPAMEFGVDYEDQERKEAEERLRRSLSGSPKSPRPGFKLFVKNDDDEEILASSLSERASNNNNNPNNNTMNTTVTQSASIAQNLRSSTTASALQARPEMNFQSLAAAAREAMTAFLVEWVNEMLARSSHGRNMMHAGVTRTSGGSTIARTITNLDTDLYDGSVYLSLCKVLLPLEHQRKGDADVFSTIVSTLFVFTAHGLQPPLIVHCPFYRRFFRADTFGSFIHPTAGLWIVGSLFCGYALRSAQSPNYRSHPALNPVHQYSPSGHHKISKQARTSQQQQNPNNKTPNFASSTRSRREQRQEEQLAASAYLAATAEVAVTRPPMNILIMSGVNTCGYGTKKAFTSSMARGDAALLHRLGVSLDKTVGNVKDDTTTIMSSSSVTNNDGKSESKSQRGGGGVGRRSTVSGGSTVTFDDDDEYNDEARQNMDFNDDFEENNEGNGDEGSGLDDDDDDDENDQNGNDENNEVVEEVDDELPGESMSFSISPRNGATNSNNNKKKKSIANSEKSQKEILDTWLVTREAVEAAQKAVPEHLLNLGPTELLQYWRTAQQNRSIWIGMARVVTSLAVRFRVFDIDTKRTEQNTARRHMQPHMTSTMTGELKVDSTSSPLRGTGTLK